MAFHIVQLSRLQKALVGIVLAALLTPLLFFPPVRLIFEGLENRTLDLRFLLRESRYTDELPLLLVLVDDASVEPHGFRSPTPRALLGEVIDNLNEKGAQCIGLDFIFDRPSRPEQDERFLQALRRSEIPVVAVPPTREPFAELVKLGFSEVHSDSSNIARTMTLRKTGAEVENSLVLALLENCFEGFPRLGPEEGDYVVMLNFFGPPTHLEDDMPTFVAVSAAELEALPAEMVEGRIVLVGSGMIDLGDTFLTSYSTRESGFKPAFGVELHSTVLGMIFQEMFLTEYPPMVLAALLFLFLGCVAVATLLFRTIFSIVAAAGLVVAWVLFSANGFTGGDIMVPVVLPVFLAGAAFVSGQLVLYFTESRYSKFLRSTFSRYMAPEVVKEMIENPEKLELGGKTREITILFTDLAGFTSISEKLTPHQVVSLLNDHLGAMADIVMDERGTVGAFIGDAVMAFYNAPADVPDHAARSCRSALRMQAAMIELNKKWKEEGFPPVEMRIGIHSGEVIIGNVGSEKRQDYTVIGDSVNLSSRLEGVNKYFGTGIIASGAALAHTNGQFITRELGRIVVKGKTEPVAIFEVVGEQNGKAQPLDDWRKRCVQYQVGLEKYYAGDFAAAIGIFRKNNEETGDGPSGFMERQSAIMEKRELPENWNGQVEMTGK